MVDSLLKTITATGSQKFYRSVEVYPMTNATDEIGVILVVTFFCGYVVKRKGTFS